ncbi:hypothetical protein M413DRAFT_31921 [Hebeloma cylindrosporum]|uniref:F-box domain-containing protein n=1 Tax=Hebeloma cylindrosporum TaxID=76867 RepID=A0A0C2XE45_HEBCY|nr:hypothetical protein M413DRAFT_31921 [Hebeloma cylindrosporum h7]
MHEVANSPQSPHSSAGISIYHIHLTDADDSSERTTEILGELVASLFISRSTRSTHPSLDPESSNNSFDNRIGCAGCSVPHFLEADIPSGKSTPGGFDVTQLPVEIICEIFEKFVEDDLPHPTFDDTPRPLISRTCRSDPTKLGQKCSRWRTVAINLQKLWSNIFIYNPKHSQIHLTEVWLARSRNTPLNLVIDYNYGTGYHLESAVQILRFFIAHLGRWKQFRLNMSIKLLGLLSALVDSPHKPLNLESVDLHFDDLYNHNHPEVHIDSIDAIWKYFHGCRNLRQVVWHGHEINSFPKHAPFQLTHVHARFCVSIDDILTFLPQLPFIQELQIEALRFPSNNPPPMSPPLLLQHLRLLSIHSHEIPATSFIARLTCPSLETLVIIHGNLFDQSTQDLQELSRLLQRSGCRLQKLDLRDSGTYIPDGEWHRCLSDSPLQFLIDLRLCTGSISDRVVGLLSRKSPTGLHEFAPFLKTLDLPSCETSDGLLARMISSRWYEALDDNHSIPLGHLREAAIFPRKHFGPIDEAFFSSNVLY